METGMGIIKMGMKMEEWKECELKDIAEIKTGPFGSQLHKKDYVKKGTPIVTVEHLGNRIFTEQNLPQVSKNDKERLKQYILKEGDIVFSRVGSVDRCSYVDKIHEGWMFSGRCLRVRPYQDLDPLYLYYLFCTENLKQVIRNIAVGATMPSINTKLLGEINIKYPSIIVQKKIAHILDSLDSKIELNNKINENLEQQAQAIYNNFLSNNIEIKKVTIEDVLSNANVGADAIKKAPVVDYDTGVKCIRIGDMTNKRPITEWGFCNVTHENLNRYKLNKYDIIVARTAVLGLNCLIYEDLQAVYNNGLIKLTVNNNKILPLILFRQMQTKDYFNYMSRIVAETSVRPNMKIQYLLDYSFNLPSIEKQQEINPILLSIFNKQTEILKENESLKKLRDTLLPKLMSGKIDASKVDI